MNAYRIRTVGQEALVGATLIVGISQPDPEKDLAAPNRLLEVSGMSRHKPEGEGILQAWRPGTEPLSKTIGKWAGRAADRLGIAGKRELLNAHGLLGRRDDGLAREDILESKTIEAVEG